MTYYDAALKVLSSAQQPLTTREITDRAVERGLIAPRGRTPERTMSAELYRRVADDANLVKIDVRGTSRARPGSVRWKLRKR
jgi:HB1, ASXL, restriction endonuclease HTH domain